MKPAYRTNAKLKRSAMARKNDRIKKAERKLVRLASRGARPRRLIRQTNRINALNQKLQLQKEKAGV